LAHLDSSVSTDFAARRLARKMIPVPVKSMIKNVLGK